MSGAAATDSSSSGSDSDDPSNSSSESESGSESGKSDSEAGPASGPEDEVEVASGAGASGAGASAPPPEPEAASNDPHIKKRNKNTEKWMLLKEWDAVQVDAELINREKLEIVTEINVAAGLDKFPVHKDRTEGLHMLTFKQSWQTTRGLVTKDVYDCPLRNRCLCKCQFLVCSSIVQTQLFVRSQHTASSHANDTGKGLKYVQRKALEQAVRVAPLQSARALARNMSNLSPTKHVDWKQYKAVGRLVNKVRADLTSVQLCGLRVDSSHGSLHELCTSLDFPGKVIRHNDEADAFHLDLFDPVCLHHEISAEHNLVIMVFSTPWMMLNHARAYNSGVPVQLVYDATGSITDCAVQIIGFGFTSFHAHVNPACVGFIPADTESEESYTTIWNAYRKALHVLLYKVKRCCMHGCAFCTDWFQQYWTGPRNGRWMLANTSYGNVTNNNCLESWWRWMKEYTCQKKRVAMCMFLANLFKHLRAESEEAAAKLRLAGHSGKFESNPQLSKKGWKYVQGLDHRTFRMCKVVQGNSTKFHNLVEEVMSLPGYENDILAHQFMEHGEGGPDRRLTLQDVWEVHMPTQWYINKLVEMLEKEGAPPTMEVLLAENDDYHDMFMKLKDEGDLPGKHIEYQLDIMRSFVILTALPQEWNKETKHTCICRSFFKHGACEHAASMSMLMDRRVQLPKAAVIKKLQHRPRRGREPTTGLGKDEGSAFSKDQREYKLPTVSQVLT